MATKPARRAPPKLPASAFATPTLPARRTYPSSITDTHVHLFSASSTVQWPLRTFQPGRNSLNGDHSFATYSQLTAKAIELELKTSQLNGFVYVQAEADHGDEDTDGSLGGWDDAIKEIDEVCKAQLASPSPKLLGLVPWAPVHHGRTAPSLYLDRLLALPSVQSLGGRSLIKSFRYLVEESPKGFFTSEPFIDGLKWCGEEGFAFDLTVDASKRGNEVLEEVMECISKTHLGQAPGQETRFILDHLCKPPIHPMPTTPLSKTDANFITSFFSLSLLPSVTVKLSGLLSVSDPELVKAAFAEFRASRSTRNGEDVPEEPRTPGWRRGSVASVSGAPVAVGAEKDAGAPGGGEEKKGSVLKRRIVSFLEPILEAFGEDRIVIGSDWPMFRPVTIASGGGERDLEEEAQAWAFQFGLYRQALVDLGLDGEGLDRVFAENAKTFYAL
ncbi:amidohydrolase family protein [Pseudohyphozyma bogoriensis]|nr:amidohydrolase family protein [Pseudohyphozyma bogoriensis]